MAIGDAVAAFLGAGTTNRQPASGVEEQISSIVKQGTTDALQVYDGSNTIRIIDEGVDPAAAATSTVYNTAIMITNSVYLRKQGTTDRIYVGGVQTNV